MTKIVDGRVISQYILSGEVTDRDLALLFQSGRLVKVGSVASVVSFPVAYGQIPAVVASPSGEDWSGVFARVTIRKQYATSFEWIADTPCSADWIAYGVK